MRARVKSFTLSELLVVIIITAIVVGLAFAVLRLIKNQIYMIDSNLKKSNALLLFEERLAKDFNEAGGAIRIKGQSGFTLLSKTDTVVYHFHNSKTIRNGEKLQLRLKISQSFFNGDVVHSGAIDAVTISARAEFPDYSIFVYRINDASIKMNANGF